MLHVLPAHLAKQRAHNYHFEELVTVVYYLIMACKSYDITLHQMANCFVSLLLITLCHRPPSPALSLKPGEDREHYMEKLENLRYFSENQRNLQ